MQHPEPTFQVNHQLVYESEQFDVACNRYKLASEFRDIEDQLRQSHAEPRIHTIGFWLGIGLAFLFPILAADFNTDFLGLRSSTWQAVAVVVVGISVIMVAIKSGELALYRWNHRKDLPPLSPTKRVELLFDEMNSTRAPKSPSSILDTEGV